MKAAMLFIFTFACLTSLGVCFGNTDEFVNRGIQVEQVVDVAPVWSGHQVGFALLTHGQRQLVAFYDSDRQMTVGTRQLNSTMWHLVRLPLPSDKFAHQQTHPPITTLGWDSHNYVTLAVDREDQIHISGNMHGTPLLYFCTTQPMEIDSLRWVPSMTGQREEQCTYPRFLLGAQGELLFTYRDGKSGSGDQIINQYDTKKTTWSRLFDQPLFSGQGKMNAYFMGPVRDRSGVFHICWVWRDSPDCATNHDLCYAQSADLIHWTTSSGKPLTLPITADTAEVVDPVPSGGGIINNNTLIGFDSKGRPVITYHKFDSNGNTQLYNARREDQGWQIYQTSDWTYRWDFHGGGSIPFKITFGPVAVDDNGNLMQSYHHVQYGSGVWQLDEDTLKPVSQADDKATLWNSIPPELNKVESEHPNMTVNIASDLGHADEPGVRYLLRWESLPPNRDQPYAGDLPKPSMLRLYKLRMPL